MAEKGLKVEVLWAYDSGHGIDISSIVPATEASKDGFFYDRHVVFSGKQESIISTHRQQWMLMI